MTDQELITAVAKNVMGCLIQDRPVYQSNTDEIVFFWNEGKPALAKPRETSETSRRHGFCNYSYNWEAWNPLTDPAAMFDVINAITAKGTWITMTIDAKETICSIGLKGFHTQATTPGMALCRAAIQWAEARQIESSANTDMLGILQEFMATRWPDGARYAAIDSNGNVFCYGNQPQPSHTVWLDTVPPNKGDPSWLTQAGWLAIEDGADWKKLIIDRPAEKEDIYQHDIEQPDEDEDIYQHDVVFCQHGERPENCDHCNARPQDETLDAMRKLATNLAPEYRWITCSESGDRAVVIAWTKKPTIGDDQRFGPYIWHTSDLLAFNLGNIPQPPSDVSYSDLIIDRQPATEYAHQVLT